jgi:hypothetical protein
MITDPAPETAAGTADRTQPAIKDHGRHRTTLLAVPAP